MCVRVCVWVFTTTISIVNRWKNNDIHWIQLAWIRSITCWCFMNIVHWTVNFEHWMSAHWNIDTGYLELNGWREWEKKICVLRLNHNHWFDLERISYWKWTPLFSLIRSQCTGNTWHIDHMPFECALDTIWLVDLISRMKQVPCLVSIQFDAFEKISFN